MKKILSCFQCLLNQFKCKKDSLNSLVTEQKFVIPSDLSDNEKIARFIFSPINVDPKSGKLKSNAYKPPANSDEISVNRLDYTDANFLKAIAIKMQNPDNKRNYFGFGIISVLDIKNSNATIVYSPIVDENLFHSDIKIGFIVKAGEELPAEVNKIIQDLVKNTKLYKDPFPEKVNWEGENLI